MKEKEITFIVTLTHNQVKKSIRNNLPSKLYDMITPSIEEMLNNKEVVVDTSFLPEKFGEKHRIAVVAPVLNQIVEKFLKEKLKSK